MTTSSTPLHEKTRIRTNKKTVGNEVARLLETSDRNGYQTLTAVLEAIANLLREHGRVAIKRFGSFSRRKRKGRYYINPGTGERNTVPDKATIFFKPSAKLIARTSRNQENATHES